MAASLDRIPMNRRIQLGNALVTQVASGSKDHLEAKLWALARLASRISFHSGPETVVRPRWIEGWMDQLQGIQAKAKGYQRLKYFYANAARITGEREFDIQDSYRQRCLEVLNQLPIEDELILACKEYVKPSQEDYKSLFGEELPIGLQLGQ